MRLEHLEDAAREARAAQRAEEMERQREERVRRAALFRTLMQEVLNVEIENEADHITIGEKMQLTADFNSDRPTLMIRGWCPHCGLPTRGQTIFRLADLGRVLEEGFQPQDYRHRTGECIAPPKPAAERLADALIELLREFGACE